MNASAKQGILIMVICKVVQLVKVNVILVKAVDNVFLAEEILEAVFLLTARVWMGTLIQGQWLIVFLVFTGVLVVLMQVIVWAAEEIIDLLIVYVILGIMI